jgi:hypothetical protein
VVPLAFEFAVGCADADFAASTGTRAVSTLLADCLLQAEASSAARSNRESERALRVVRRSA